MGLHCKIQFCSMLEIFHKNMLEGIYEIYLKHRLKENSFNI